LILKNSPGKVKRQSGDSGMNKKQKVVFLMGVGIIVLMGLMPPWYYHHVGFSDYSDQPIALEINGDYAWLFSPPISDLPGLHKKDTLVLIDLSRLLIQWAVVAIATAGIVLVLKDKR
jgi:hypothetical protein